MTRETKRRLAGFFTAFCTTLTVMSGALAAVYLARQVQAQAENQPVPTPNAYLPQEEDRLTILVAGQEDPDTPPDAFYLIGFSPHQGRVAVCLLPPALAVGAWGQEETLASLYEKGGVRYVQKVLGEDLEIPIDRYAVSSLEALDRVLTRGGLMDYYLPVDLHYQLRGREIWMPKGNYQLDGRKAADILNCTTYQGGELERSDRGGMLISQIIQENLPAFLSDAGDALVEGLFTWLDTDVSYTDYDQRREALAFLAALELPATTTVFLEGTWEEDVLVLTQDCRNRLRESYGDAPQQEEGAAAEEEDFAKQFA